VQEFHCIEGVPFQLDTVKLTRLRTAWARLQTQLRPRFRVLNDENGWIRLQGIIGTVDLGDGTVLQITPKVESNADWIRAVLDLLVGSDRVDAAGERAAGLSPNRRNLLEVLASIYAARLERAFHRDGPIQILNRHERTIPFVKGKLDVTRWLRRALETTADRRTMSAVGQEPRCYEERHAR